MYSWGVLHHSPDTPRAIAEVHRVLRPGGVARVMIYHYWSITGYMLWLRYGLLRGRSLRYVYAKYLESPGTKAYTIEEAEHMFRDFKAVFARSQLSFGDLLQGAVGQRHNGRLLTHRETILASSVHSQPVAEAWIDAARRSAEESGQLARQPVRIDRVPFLQGAPAMTLPRPLTRTRLHGNRLTPHACTRAFQS